MSIDWLPMNRYSLRRRGEVMLSMSCGEDRDAGGCGRTCCCDASLGNEGEELHSNHLSILSQPLARHFAIAIS
jgi:hypothetical protein